MNDELELKGGSGFSGMDSRKVGFGRKIDTEFSSKRVPTYGPRVREPQETLQIRPRAAVSEASPLKLTIVQGTAANKFQIVAGYVNGEMPTLSSVALDAATPPEITVTADVWVWIKVVGTFGTPDSYVVTIETNSTSDVPAGTAITATGFTSFYRIGDIDFTSGSPDTYDITNQHGGGNLGVDSWGLYNLWWRA